MQRIVDVLRGIIGNAGFHADGVGVVAHEYARKRLADIRLVAMDMDSTLINIECIDEMAGMVGRQQEVSAITEAAMRGEIADYKDSLRQRVALLRGAPAGV
ncbi:MAG: hypothetical protein WCN98_06580, partial [Verrucomicrobiaceae bacterium]